MPQLEHPHATFPRCLRVKPTDAVIVNGGDLARIEEGNVVRHNTAVQGFGIGMANLAEERTLHFLQAFYAWCRDDAADSGYGAEHITYPLSVVFSNILNLDLGRLDGGCLSSWVCAKLERLGIDPDTGELS